ncbi:hypothetical protein OIU78_026863 [Salix suchowensis]|nr:hypothetical protein OIU78_026863 [Salix suchowensis]
MTCVFIPQDGRDVEDGMENSTAEISTDWTNSDRKEKAKRDTEGLIEFLETVITLAILYFHARPKKSPSEHFTVIKRPLSQIREEMQSILGNLLVAAVLVAGVTFAGAIQLPQLRDNISPGDQHHELNSTSRNSSHENLLYVFDLHGLFGYCHDVRGILLLCENSIARIPWWAFSSHHYSGGRHVFPCSGIPCFSLDYSAICQPNSS